MANEITRRYGAQKLIGLSLHPGVIMTELARHMDESDFENMDMPALKSPEQGAATTVWAALSDHFEGTENAGRYLADVGEATPATGNDAMGDPIYAPHAYDEQAEKTLWKVSCEVAGVADD